MKPNKNLILFNVRGSRQGPTYKYVGVSGEDRKSPTRWFSLGNLEKLLNENWTFLTKMMILKR